MVRRNKWFLSVGGHGMWFMVYMLNFFPLFKCCKIVCIIVLFCVVGWNISKGVNVGAMTSGAGYQSVGGTNSGW